MAGETVLVVDDEPHVADLYAGWLAEDYEVVTAYGGREALDRFDGDVEIVLLDRRMPVTGDEVVADLRDRGFEGPIAMVTAVDADFDIVDMAVTAYLTKPVARADVRELVDQLSTLRYYEAEVRRLFELASKVGALEGAKLAHELDDNEEFGRLRAELAELKAGLDDTVAALDDREFEALMHRLPSGEGP